MMRLALEIDRSIMLLLLYFQHGAPVYILYWIQVLRVYGADGFTRVPRIIIITW